MGWSDPGRIDSKPIDSRRYYCAYTELEEWRAGMWKRTGGEPEKLRAIAGAVSLLRSPERFAAALERVLAEWPTSCRAELTARGNHLAWMGAAACCLTLGVPEDLTRRAWWKLSEAERGAADDLARRAIARYGAQHG